MTSRIRISETLATTNQMAGGKLAMIVGPHVEPIAEWLLRLEQDGSSVWSELTALRSAHLVDVDHTNSPFWSRKHGGTLTLVGLPKDNRMQLPIFETVLGGLHVTGSIVGTRVDLQEVFELHAMGRTRVTHEERELESVNEAIEEVESGEVDAGLVFDPGVGEPARKSDGILLDERSRPSAQPTGEAEVGKGPIPG